MKLMLQVCVVLHRAVSFHRGLLLLLLHSDLQEAGAAAHLPLQQAPLHVVLDGLEEQVVLVHVPLLVAGDLGGLHLLRLVVVVVNGGLLLQRHVAEQAGHHDGLVHVVGGCYEAVHDVEERVLVAGRVVAELHHRDGFGLGLAAELA